MMSEWYNLDTTEVLQCLETDGTYGLEEARVRERQVQYGANEVKTQGGKGPWRVLWEQVASIMIVILLVAAVVSVVLGDSQDAVIIMAIVVLNILLGFTQEYRAQRAMVALRKLAVPTVRVRRESQVREIPANELVPGDIALLEAGNIVPADGRILESANLRVQESALTGESEAVEKTSHTILEADLSVGDRLNMMYMGTVVVYGRSQMVVTATGMETELGHIAHMLRITRHEPTPLQKRLNWLGKVLIALAFLLVVIIVLLGVARGERLSLLFLTGVSMAVAAVPEGLPAIVTIALALGSQRMLRRHALIRKLTAVEALGSVTVICSDKTGTLTENRMTVTHLQLADRQVDLTEYLRAAPQGTAGTQPGVLLQEHPGLALLMAGAALCTDAVLQRGQVESDSYVPVGDPTEGALVVAAAQLGIWKDAVQQVFPRIFEVPFDSTRKRMTTVHRIPISPVAVPEALEPVWTGMTGKEAGTAVAFTKGAVDSLLKVSSRIWVSGQTEGLDAAWHERLLAASDDLAQQGMRILGVAFRPVASLPEQQGEAIEHDLIFIGLIGMRDPIRPEVKEAVQTCRQAGIRPIMITGDHPLTARHIADALGISSNHDRLLTGHELERLSPTDLEQQVEEVSVYARVSPEHKLEIVQALQNHGHIVAMTGDGVNDAPALRKADIGVAMGVVGTDVAKEAADMVLLDDNFATIVAAVEEGRVIYDNIRKFIKYMIAANLCELLVMLVGPFLGMPLPLFPLQILWINLVTDGLPALALSVEPAEQQVMRRPPSSPTESFFARGIGREIVLLGSVTTVVSLGTGFWYWFQGNAGWQTMLFTVLTFSQMALALAVRSERESLLTIGVWSNTPLLGAVTLTLLLQLALVYLPLLQGIFRTNALPAGDFALALVVSTIPFWFVEGKKLLMRQKWAHNLTGGSA